MSEVGKMFIDGEWVLSSSGDTRDVINPADGTLLGKVAEGTVDDVRKAVQAAKRAFYTDGWSESSALDRAGLLFSLADELEKHTDEIAKIDCMNNGKPFRESQYDVSDSAACLRYYAGMVSKPQGQTFHVPDPNVHSMTVREPIGVVGQIIAWNFPLSLAAWKLAPALATGNSVVFKPSELTPLSIMKVFELMEKVGFPKGVVNLVMGAGAVVGNELAENEDIEKITFTGGIKTGRSIMRAAAGNMKGVSMELGGKSPNIVFADADFEAAVDYAMYGIFVNQGEVCSAGSRLLLEDKIYDRFMEELVARTKKIKIGSCMEKDVILGPLVSEAHMKKVLNYIEIGKQEGATIACGGNRVTANGLDKGFFVEPTIFVDTTPDMRIVQEEIFGPVLVVQKFSGEDEAIRLANHTKYGLAGGVFTSDGSKAMRVISKLRAGITWVNTYGPVYNEAPWGGYKQSGFGRELGTYGLDEYTEIKQININMNPCPSGWFDEA